MSDDPQSHDKPPSTHPEPTADPESAAPESGPIPLAPDEFGQAGRGSPYPVARPAADRRESGAAVGGPSILQTGDETCPRCGGRLQPDAVVCVMCGYDLRVNQVRPPQVGIDESVGPPPEPPPFVPSKPESTKPLLIVGGLLTVLGMATAGWSASSLGGAWYVIARIVLVAYLVLLHTATGAAAIISAAWLTSRRLGSLEQATVRMLVTVAGFVLILQTPDFGLHAWLVGSVRWLTAAGVYFALLLALFRKNRQDTGIVAGAHAIFWLLTSIGMQLALWVSSVQPTPTP